MPFWNRARSKAIKAAEGHTVYVAPSDGGWVVRVSGRFTTQDTAEVVARTVASLLELELELRGEDGTIRAKDSHGHDDPDVPG